MMCEACERGDHDQCGLQTWCQCDCDGTMDMFMPDYSQENDSQPDDPEPPIIMECAP